MHPLAEQVRNLRKRLGLTQQQFADALQINRSYVSELEHGIRPSKHLLERIEALERDPVGKVGAPHSTGYSLVDLPGRLKAWRKRLHLSPADASRVLRISENRYKDYEEGSRSQPNLFLAEKFSILEHESSAFISELLHDAEGLTASPTSRVAYSSEPPSSFARVREEALPPEGYEYRPHPQDLSGETTELRWIPLLSWADAVRSLEQDFGDVASWERRVPTCVKDPHAVAIEIRGDSMEPKISEGDIATVLCSLKPQSGDMVIARLRDGSLLCKLFHIQREGRLIVLTSYNPAYPPAEHTEEEFHWIYPVHSVSKMFRK